MRRSLSLSLLILCLALASPAFALSPAKETWTRVRSKNFLLIGNASEKDIIKVATRLEQFHDVLTRLFSKAKATSSTPTTVIVFKNDGAYKPFKPLWQGKPANVAGYFVPGEDVNYITLAADDDGPESFRTIFHEYVHLWINNNMRNPPVWFNEGLAEYYSTFEMTGNGKEAILGRAVDSHVLRLRQQGLFPLQTLFAVDHKSSHYNEREKQGIFYAQSWALVHYLVIGDEAKRRMNLARFLDQMAVGVPVEQAFKQAFQVDFAAMEKELKSYIQRNSYLMQSLKLDGKQTFDAAVKIEPVSEAEAQYYLGDLLLHIDRTADAEKYLTSALALDANFAPANTSLGMVRLDQKRYAEAKQLLQRAAAASPNNYLAHYNYAYALSREGMSETEIVSSYDEATAATMRAELKKAIALAPANPAPYHLLAFVNLVTGEEIDESIQMLKRALELAPGRGEFAIVLAQLYVRKREFAVARQILEPLASNHPDPDTRAQAQAILVSVVSIAEQASRYNSANDAAGDSPAGPPRLVRREAKDDDAATEEDSPVDADPLAYIRAAMRKPAAGETRVQGLLTRIDCDQKGITFIIKAGDRLLKFRHKGFEGIYLRAFAEVTNELTCGARKPENDVVITYIAASDARAKIDGEVIALEFMPKGFTLKQ